MSAKEYYNRDLSFRYRLQSHPSYWFYVGKSVVKQCIMGLLKNKFYVLTFNSTGDLVDVEEQALEFSPLSSDEAVELDRLHEVVEGKVRQVRKEEDLVDETIEVKRFRLSALQAGIDDLPDDLQEYVAKRNSSSLSDDELEEAIDGWTEESLFVFWWGQSFSVSCDGAVTSS